MRAEARGAGGRIQCFPSEPVLQDKKIYHSGRSTPLPRVTRDGTVSATKALPCPPSGGATARGFFRTPWDGSSQIR